jgi:hypothetical protein
MKYKPGYALQEAQARLAVVEQILEVETHPDYLRTYRRSRTQLKNRIAAMEREIARTGDTK